jgi:hypothetical protein
MIEPSLRRATCASPDLRSGTSGKVALEEASNVEQCIPALQRVVIAWCAMRCREPTAIRPAGRPAQAAQKKEKPRRSGAFSLPTWRREPESNRPKRLCRPLHNRFAIAPKAGLSECREASDRFFIRGPSVHQIKREAWLPHFLERETSLELATSTLARLRSTN